MAKSKRRMTAVEFEAIRHLLNLSRERTEAARAALVDGQPYLSIASPHGWTRQAVADAVSIVWKTLEKYRLGQKSVANASVLLPPGWEQVTLIAPSRLVEKFRTEIATYTTGAETEDSGQSVRQATVAHRSKRSPKAR